MRYAYCPVPVAPVRLEPSHRTEMVNQLLYGEAMEVLEGKDDWFRIRSLYDNYEGWVTWHMVQETDAETALLPATFVVKDPVGVVSTGNGTIHLPMGASLSDFDPANGRLSTNGEVFKGNYNDTSAAPKVERIIETAHALLFAPYLWGGKTIFGIDCSGFVQTVFRVHGLRLLRDAFQQAEQGFPVPELPQAKAGDLAFFHNEKGRIIHVGMLLNPSQIIHASGNVRIDPIDAGGITHLQTGRKTHQLHSLRRLVL